MPRKNRATWERWSPHLPLVPGLWLGQSPLAASCQRGNSPQCFSPLLHRLEDTSLLQHRISAVAEYLLRSWQGSDLI